MPKSPSRKTADLKIAIENSTRGSGVGASPTRKAKAQAGRIMYIECKAGALTGVARIGRVTFSKTGRTLYYRGQTFQSLKGRGFKSNSNFSLYPGTANSKNRQALFRNFRPGN